eukprot:CAMPEP_0194314432 /NCGR_PEP_ID=MMETSP0171-20130528/11285_1 /TAXON_ID=218684 /ORGANISM="Corethron pennatum, Strain L29A3" /LENGTH=386 /DNA_ID=CAMNT_0039069847 /DNA_START=60 /DNA_END=1220 /DNA_ORIENTATION=-
MTRERNLLARTIYVTSACLAVSGAHATVRRATPRKPVAFVIGPGAAVRRPLPFPAKFGRRRHRHRTSVLRMVLPPPGSGYRGPEDEPDYMPEGYRPMMQYPGTMRPTMEKENIPYEDLPLDDDDVSPVPWPNFQDLPFYHHWGSPHEMQTQMEVFIENEGRWLSPEEEEELERGSKASRRGPPVAKPKASRPNVVIDDDEDDDEEGDGALGLIGAIGETGARIREVAESAAQPSAGADAGDEDDGDDLLGALGLGDLDDDDDDIEDGAADGEDGVLSAAGEDDGAEETGDLLVSFDDSSSVASAGLETGGDVIGGPDGADLDGASEMNEDESGTDADDAADGEGKEEYEDDEGGGGGADAFGEFDDDYTAEDSFDDIEDMDNMLGF